MQVTKITIILFVLLFIFALPPVIASDPFTINQKLGRGVNLGDALDAPFEGKWGVFLREEYFSLIAAQGFDSVRIPIRWSAHAETEPPYRISENFFRRVDWAIDQALNNGLLAIINFHHYEELQLEPEQEWERFLVMWEQVARRYKDYPETLVFEILNEPRAELTPERWNFLLAEALAVIRKENPHRVVLIGTAEWGTIGGLSKLKLPRDDHLILTIHYYNPFDFTHQGADWVEPPISHAVGIPWLGNAFDKRAVINDMQAVLRFSRKHKIPVNIGEFGVIAKADPASRARWSAFCARLFEEYGFSWHYWDFCSNFRIFDQRTRQFDPLMVEALFATDPSIIEVSEPPVGTGANLIRNGQFTNGTTLWTFGAWQAPARATGQVRNGAFVVNVRMAGTEDWHIQLIQDGLTFENSGLYMLRFDAKADRYRPMHVLVDGGAATNYHYYDGAIVELTLEQQTYYLLLNLAEPVQNGRLVFNLASAPGVVTLDNISLEKYD